MRINSDNKTMDMEVRDVNYILPAYVRSYQFHSENQLPAKIIFPMFVSVKAGGVDIPIEWVPPLEPVAVEITKDGSNVAEVTPEQEAALDERDEEIARLKKELADATQTGRRGDEVGGTGKPEASADLDENAPQVDENYEAAVADIGLKGENASKPAESPARKAFEVDPDPTHQPTPDRTPKQPPGGDIGAGQPLSDTHPRGRDDQRRTARDLLEEPEIEGAAEKPFDKEVKRDKKGNPIVEDKPDA